jgi:hypothetical protein
MASVLSWRVLAPADGDYSIVMGRTYAAQASATKNYTKSQIATYLASHGWGSVSIAETGDPGVSLPVDANTNHRTIYVQAMRTGPDASLSEDSSPFTIYSITTAWEYVATDVPDPPPPPPKNWLGAGFVWGVTIAGLVGAFVLVRRRA